MNLPPTRFSRREFLATVAAAGTAMAMGPSLAWAADAVSPEVANLAELSLGIDTHNHVDVPILAADVPGPDIDLAGDLKRSGLAAVCATFAVDYQPFHYPGEAYDRFASAMASLDQQLQRNHIRRSLSLADLQRAHKAGEPAVIQAIEGGHFLEGKPERVAEAYGRGLRVLGLLHDNDAAVPLGDVYTKPPRFGGLTKFGAEVVGECNRLGIVIDLTHADRATVTAALQLSTKPVIFSHTGLDTRLGRNPSMAKMMRSRLISADECKQIAGAGGLVGVWTHLSDSPVEYARNVQALVEVIGVDSVCIGTDTKLTRPLRPRGVPDPGPRIGERTNLAWAGQTTGFYYTLVDAMLKVGFTPADIAKVGGGNFCRVFDAATSGRP